MNHLAQDTPVRSRKPKGQGASRRGEILAAAKRLFLEEGFARTTLRRIAALVGVSPTALYLHFADKEAILAAIAEDYFDELLAVIEATQKLDKPLLERFRAGVRAYVDLGLARPDEYRLTFLTRFGPGIPAPCEKPMGADGSFAILQNGVEQLMAEGIFRRQDSLLSAEAIWCCLHGTTTALMNLGGFVQSDGERLIDTVIDVALEGFTHSPPRASLAE